MDDFTELKTSLKTNEGCVPYMYLDTKGNVTVGVGHMLKACGDAQKLSFMLRQNPAAANAEQIANDFNSVSQQQKGQFFTHYEQFTLLNMPPETMESLLDADIATTEQGVREKFSGYDNYPLEAKTALLDMAFNLGVDGLATKFPRLKAAAEAGNWNTCTMECEREGVQPSRNAWTKRQFESAANAAPAAASTVTA